MRRIFMKTISEGLVAVITFDNVTNRHHIEVREEDEVFEEWACVSCRKEMFNLASMYDPVIRNSLNRKLEQWLEKEDLCFRLETESWLLILQSL